MKALSLRQPWATAVAIGVKQWETRSWRPRDLPGRIAIHASANRNLRMDGFAILWANADIRRAFTNAGFDLIQWDNWDRLPFGAIIATCSVDALAPAEWVAAGPAEQLLGDFSEGRSGWRLTGVQPLTQPIPCKGHLGLWTIPPNIEAEM